MRPQLRMTVLLCLPLLAVAAACAQEPAFFNGSKAVRFPEGNGTFHYLGPCVIPGASAQAADPAGGTGTPAICWYVTAIRIRKVNGKMEASPATAGRLAINAEELRFLPSAAGDQALDFRAPLSHVTFHHNPGKPFAILASEDTGYQFAFSGICIACAKNAAPADPSALPSQEPEFDLLAQAFTQFDAVSRRVTDLAATAEVPAGASAQNPQGPVPVTDRLLASHLIKRVEPLYPSAAKDIGTEGSVILHALVSKDGNVEDLKVVSGPVLLQNNAMDAVRQWKYKPFLINGQAVSVTTDITVTFTMAVPDSTRSTRH